MTEKWGLHMIIVRAIPNYCWVSLIELIDYCVHDK
jgi:hypothetical protein